MNPVEAASIPIPGETPAGSDIRMEPLFEQLQDELTISPTSGSQKGVSWERVVEISTDILATKSKDMLVAGYLAVGMLHVKGLPDGLLDGITLLRELIEKYWDNLFPPAKRMRGRTQAIAWWNEKTQEYLRNTEPGPVTAQIHTTLSEQIDALFDLVSEKCPDAPSIRFLLEYARTLPVIQEDSPEEPPAPTKDESPQAPPKSQSPAQSQSPSKSTHVETLATPSVITSIDDFNRIQTAVIENSWMLIDYMLKMEPQPSADPSWYSMNLILAWLDIKKLPPATDGKTLIPPPDSAILNSIQSMRTAANWPGIVKSACYTIRKYPFWIDMNRYTVEALNAIGSQYGEAVRALSDTTASFAKRFSGIETYAFSNGVPFAEQETRAWLASITVQASPPGKPAQTSDTADDLDSRVEEGFRRCREMFGNGKQGEGLALMQQLMKESGSARERCLWRLALLRLLALAGMEKLAIPHLNELMRDFDRYQIETWEPPLALEILKIAWNLLKSQKEDESRKRSDEILSRISMLDPAEALKLMK